VKSEVPAPVSNAAIANTQLLTCQSNRFKDNSTNNFTLTRNGDVAVKSLGPFTETDIVTGSGYLDGTGDYLVTSGAALDTGAGTSDFTMECWVYNNGYSGSQYGRGIFTFYPAAGYANSRFMFRLNNGGDQINIYLYISGTLHANVTSTVLATPGAWTHLAFVRQSGTFKLYINGTIESSMTVTGVSASLNTFDKFDIGRNQDGSLPDFNGYISNFRYVKGTAVYTANFTPPTAALTAIANTSLLILQNRQGHNNSAFLDTSGNKFNITRNGNTTQGTFTPFSQAGWSVYFDGTGDYLKTGTATPIATTQSTFTVEAFIYMTANPSSSGNPNIPTVVGDMAPDSGAANWTFGPTSSRALSFYWYTGSLNSAVGNTIMALNAWHHIAVSVSANAIKLFVNGVLQTLTGTTTLTNRLETLNYIGFGQNNNTNHVFTGYASNIRIVSGTALYTAAFTPSTAALTAVANTALLTCQNNRFIDNSTNNFTLTATGTPKVQAFSPFKPTALYSAATHGGSAYFDGTSDYLSFTANSTTVGPGDFTIELWYYPTVFQNFDTLFGNTRGANGFNIGTNVNATVVWYSSAALLIDSGKLQEFAWNHIAFTRTSNTLRMYLNGSQTGATPTVSTNFSATGFVVGDTAGALGEACNGYISGIRVTNQSLASGSTFTVPTAPYTSNVNTNLLLNFTNAGVIDQSGRTDLETVGDARISTTVKKYGTGSMYFDGTGDYLYAESSPNFELSSGDFTVEAWIYPTTIAGAERGIFGIGTTDPDSNLVRIQASTSKLQFWLGGSNSGGPGAGTKTGIITCSTALSLNTWYHIALVRSGSATNNVKLYLNGVSDGQGTATYTIGAKPFSLGMGYPGSVTELFIGYIDEFRITKGVARYTATFTPPTTEVLTK